MAIRKLFSRRNEPLAPSPQNNAPIAPISGKDGPGQSSDADVIWEEAYGQVKANPSFKNLVEEFEEAIIIEMAALPADSRSSITQGASLVEKMANIAPKSRQNLMAKLVDTADRDRSSQIREISLKVASVFEQTKDGIGAILDAYPPVSIAWAGVCLVFNHAKAVSSNRDGLADILS